MRRHRNQRGASGVEYALIASLVALATLGAIDFLEDAGSKKADQTAEAMSTRTIPSLPPSDDGGGGGGGGGGGATTSTSSSTTTTTLPQATKALAAWTGSRRSNTSSSSWRAEADLRVTDDLGARVQGASVRVDLATRRGSGSWKDAGSVTGTTKSDGSVTFQAASLARSGPNRIDEVRFTVRSVTASGLSYVSGSIATTVSRP